MVINQCVNRIVARHPDPDAGTDVSTYGSRVGKTKTSIGTRTRRTTFSRQLSLRRGECYVFARLRIAEVAQVVLEKRLGIAQLCLLLAVLVFIGLTRGAPSAQHHPPTVHRSTREMGVRSLSFGSSADGWNPLRGRSRSPSERRGSAKAEKATGNYHLIRERCFTELVP